TTSCSTPRTGNSPNERATERKRSNRRGMKKLLVTFSLVSLFMVSCMSTTEYKDAGIRITTNPRVVAGMQFVNGWTRSYSDVYVAGEIEAVMLAEKGARDVTVL